MKLDTTYLGLALRSPIVPSASPLSMDLDGVRRMADAGAGAIVLGSLFEEQIRHDAATFFAHHELGAESHGEALDYLPAPDEYALGPHEYLEHVRRCVEAVDVPIVASLNAGDPGAWIEYAALLEQAGADALELNVYRVAADVDRSGADVERDYLEIVSTVRASTELPLAVKLGPYFSSLPAMAAACAKAGADGLVLFNRFYQPDLDLDELEVVPNLELSRSADSRLALRWIAILCGRVDVDFAATGGIHEACDALKAIAAGASVAMVCAALMQRGIEHIAAIEREMRAWLVEREYDGLDTLRGSLSQRACPDPEAFERANYTKALLRYL